MNHSNLVFVSKVLLVYGFLPLQAGKGIRSQRFLEALESISLFVDTSTLHYMGRDLHGVVSVP